MQLLPTYEVHNLPSQIKMWDTFYLQLFVYILYVFCIQIAYILLMMYTFCRSELMYTKCIQDVYKMCPTFRQTFVYILYTNFNSHSYFRFFSPPRSQGLKTLHPVGFDLKFVSFYYFKSFYLAYFYLQTICL